MNGIRDVPLEFSGVQGTAGDDPGNSLNNTMDAYSMNDSFKDYIMFLPPGASSQWVPVESADWNITLNVARIGIAWRITNNSSATHTEFANESSEPTWDVVFNGLSLMTRTP